MAAFNIDFTPPHCPNPKCDFHLNAKGWRYKKDGFHFRQFDSRSIQRYRCSQCRRSFSTQTFSTTYWLKRPDLPVPTVKLLVSCAGYRQIARCLEVSPSTIELQAARLGRHMLLFHELHRPQQSPQEPLVYDGFETFEFSQYWPTHLNTVIGAESHFTYATTAAGLRRKGRMTEKQRARRQELEARYGRPDPQAIEKTTAQALRLVLPPGTRDAVLRSDEHTAYPRAIEVLSDCTFQHETTSSKIPRTLGNPMFPANLLHLLMRHSGANHKRETIAFSKRLQSMVWRDAVHRVWRNYVKHFSEKARGGSPAMRLGIFDRLLKWPEILRRRLFATRMPLPMPLDGYYWGRIQTCQIAHCREHGLQYAF